MPALAAALFVPVGCASGSGPGGSAASDSHAKAQPVAPHAPEPPSASSTAARPSLPRGGRTIFPNYRVVAYYGGSDGPGLGILGASTADEAAAAVDRQAQLYAFAGRPVQPALELIATVALADPGPDGTYSSHGDPAAVDRYLAAARRHKELLVLDFQPGQGDYLTQIQRFARFVAEPDVGIALDPEWHMKSGEVPGKTYGSSSAASINAVSAYLDGIVANRRLPQKLLVIHQFRTSMLPDRSAIVARPGLATVFHADGNGTPDDKVKVYGILGFPGPPFYRGFKLFLTRDTPLLSPRETMALSPAPDLVTYQ